MISAAASPSSGHCPSPVLQIRVTVKLSTGDHRLRPSPGRGSSGACRSAPLVDALSAAAEDDAACFHFPGHRRGHAAPPSLTRLIGASPFAHDLTELTDLDDLFSPKGPILRAQQLAASLFGASQTWFLVGGSTCGVQAAVMATCSPGETLILPRNCHASATSAMVLSGAVPKYITPLYNPRWSLPLGVTAAQVEAAIREAAGAKPAAVLLTSPTYHGVCSPLREISAVCRRYGLPLLVDEAHGGHFDFHAAFPRGALRQGADLAVQSTHKVLSSLTQSSMLHVSGDLVDRERIRRCLQALQSSSPSFLLLASLDAARAQISDGLERGGLFDVAVELAEEMKAGLEKIAGVEVLACPDLDPLRVTVRVSGLRLTGYEADEILELEHKVLSELAGPQTLTFAVNLGTRREDVERLVNGLGLLSESMLKRRGRGLRVEERVEGVGPFEVGRMVLSPREAFFARKRKVAATRSVGEVCGELICPYPPGIPLLVPGEVITGEALKFLLEAKDMGAAISGAADDSLSSIVVCDS